MPVTTPLVPIVATELDVLTHVPPVIELIRLSVWPTHVVNTVAPPMILLIVPSGFTVTL